MFLHRFISKPYPELWAFLQKLLVLSHGQATVERGFSINKEVEICNIQEDTIIALRIVCDYVSLHGGLPRSPSHRNSLPLPQQSGPGTKSILRMREARMNPMHRARKEGPQRNFWSNLKRVEEPSRKCLKVWPEMWTSWQTRLRESKAARWQSSLPSPMLSEGATRRSWFSSRTWMNKLRPREQSSEECRLLCLVTHSGCMLHSG